MKITLTLDIPDLAPPNAPHAYKLEAACLTLHDIADQSQPPVLIHVNATSSDVTASSVVGPGDMQVDAAGHLVDECCPPDEPCPEDDPCCGSYTTTSYDLRGATINIGGGSFSAEGIATALGEGIARAMQKKD